MLFFHELVFHLALIAKLSFMLYFVDMQTTTFIPPQVMNDIQPFIHHASH